MAVEGATAGIVLQTALLGANTFQQYAPRLTEVRRADPEKDLDIVGDVRMGEFAGLVISVSIGALASWLTQSSVPVVISLLAGLMMVFIYESALRGNRPFEG